MSVFQTIVGVIASSLLFIAPIVSASNCVNMPDGATIQQGDSYSYLVDLEDYRARTGDPTPIKWVYRWALLDVVSPKVLSERFYITNTGGQTISTPRHSLVSLDRIAAPAYLDICVTVHDLRVGNYFLNLARKERWDWEDEISTDEILTGIVTYDYTAKRRVNVVAKTLPNVSVDSVVPREGDNNPNTPVKLSFKATDAGKDISRFDVKRTYTITKDGTRTTTSTDKQCQIYDSESFTCGITDTVEDDCKIWGCEVHWQAFVEDALGNKASTNAVYTKYLAQNTAPVIQTFRANKNSVAENETVTLTIDIKDDDKLSSLQLKDVELKVNNSVNSLKSYNSNCTGASRIQCTVSVTITESTDITLTVSDNNVVVTANLSIGVEQAPSFSSFTVTPTHPAIGMPVNLYADVALGQLSEYYFCKFLSSEADQFDPRSGCDFDKRIGSCDVTKSTCFGFHTHNQTGSVTYSVYAKSISGMEYGQSYNVYYQNALNIYISPLSAANAVINEGEKFKFSLNVSSSLLDRLSFLQSLELKVGNKTIPQSDYTIYPALPVNLVLPGTGNATVNVEWRPSPEEYADNIALTFVAKDNHGNRVERTYRGLKVNYIKRPEVPVFTLEPVNNQGQYNARFSAFTNTEHVQFEAHIGDATFTHYETVPLADVDVTGLLTYTQSLNAKLEHHGKTLRVRARGYSGTPGTENYRESQWSDYRRAVIYYEAPAPQVTAFVNYEVQEGGDFTLQWRNQNDGATHYYKVLSWPGLANAKATATVEEEGQTQTHALTLRARERGVRTYEVVSCNSQDLCLGGHQLTIEHIPPVISSASFSKASNGSCPNESILTINGMGFHATQSEVEVRIRKTGKTQFLNNSALTVSRNKIEGKVSKAICEALSSGGVSVTASNGVMHQSAPLLSVIQVDGSTSDRQALLDRPFSYSNNGYLYIGDNQGLKAYFVDMSKNSSGLIEKDHFQVSNHLGEVKSKPLVESLNGKDAIYFGAENAHFYKVDHLFNQNLMLLKWFFKTSGVANAQAQLDEQSNLYVGTLNGVLYSVNPESGAVQWHYNFPNSGGIVAQPQIFAPQCVDANGVPASPEQCDEQKSEDPLINPTIVRVVTGDEQVHDITKRMMGANAFKWQDLHSHITQTYKHEYENWLAHQWQPSEDSAWSFEVTRAVFMLLQKNPSKAEVSFLTYLLAHGHIFNEMVNAMINANGALPTTPHSYAQFVAQLFEYASGTTLTNSLAGKTQAQWVSALESGETHANVAIEILRHSGARYTDAAFNALHYFYGICTGTSTCLYDTDSDGDGISDWVELEVGKLPYDGSDGLPAPTLTYKQTPGKAAFTFSSSEQVDGYRLYERVSSTGAFREIARVSAEQVGEFLAYYRVHHETGSYRYRARACLNAPASAPHITNVCSANYSQELTIDFADSQADGAIGIGDLVVNVAEHSAISADLADTNASLAATLGSFRVTEGGSASYTIPITLPSGIAGVTPEVSLTYNSQSPQSALALGWSLNAAESIARCRQTTAQDGGFKAINYDDGDRYCLNGQRLIEITELDQAYPTHLAVYKTEIDSHIRVLRRAGATAEFFEVHGKDGSIKTFGDTDNTRVTIDAYGGDGNQTLTWLLRAVSDNMRNPDNEITYTYKRIFGADDTGADSLPLLEKIEYSGNTVTIALDTAPFVRSIAVNEGTRLRDDGLINGISITNHEQIDVGRYDFTFEDAGNGARLLTQVKHCITSSHSNSEVCKQPVKFEYNAIDTRFMVNTAYHRNGLADKPIAGMVFADTQGDGSAEQITLEKLDGRNYRLCAYSDVGAELTCQQIRRGVSVGADKYHSDEHLGQDDHVSMLAMDIKGEGKQSIWINFVSEKMASTNAAYWQQFTLSSTNAFSAPSNLPLLNKNTPMFEIKAADLNGDGYLDLVFKNDKEGKDLQVSVWNKRLGHYPSGTNLQTSQSSKWGRFTQKGTDWQLLDMNFDGLADIMSLTCPVTDSCEEANANTITVHYNRGLAGDSESNLNRFVSATVADRGMAIGGDSLQFLTPVDVNNDGLVDIAYMSKHDTTDTYYWRVLINRSNRGNHPSFESVFSLEAGDKDSNKGDVSNALPPLISDTDRDGFIDFYFKNKTGSAWQKYEWSPERFTLLKDDSSELTIQDFDVEQGDYAYFTDVQGDMRLDLVHKSKHEVTVFTNANTRATDGMLKAIYQGGHGQTQNKTEIQYRLTIDEPLDTAYFADIYVDAEEDLATDKTRFDAQKLRVQPLVGAMVLVSKVTSDSPATNNISTTSSVEYQYQGAKAQFGGRGMLGFQKVSTAYSKQGTTFTTHTRYHQAFPLTGMPYATEKWMSNANIDKTLISKAVNSYQVIDGTANYKQVYSDKVRECQARVSSALGVTGFTCAQTTTAQDTYGNVTSTQVANYDYFDAEAFTVNGEQGEALKTLTTTNTYSTDVIEKRLGRLASTEVTHTTPDAGDKTLSSAFTYYGSGHAHAYMLKDEIVGSNLGCGEKLTKTHMYDAWGNTIRVKSATTDCETGEVQSRMAQTTFDEAGRYAVYATQFAQSCALAADGSAGSCDETLKGDEVVERNRFGQATRIKDVNHVESTVTYDAFGQKLGTYHPSGAQSYSYLAACNGTETVACAFISRTVVNGEMLERQYIDRVGRVIKQEKRTVLDTWVASQSFYDEYGRVVTVQKPHEAGIQSDINTLYDEFDRVISTEDTTSGLTTTHTYGDFEHIAQVSGTGITTQTTTTYTNGLGQTVRVLDTRDNTLTYKYGPTGLQTQVYSSAESGASTLLISTQYDALGRKVKMEDADRGTWSYAYNGFGELVKQTDARLVSTHIRYDGFGRKIKSWTTSPSSDAALHIEGISSWEYGNTATDRHQLKVAKQGRDWAEYYYYDGLGRQVSTLTSVESALACHANTQVVFNTAQYDLRLAASSDPDMQDPLKSQCVIRQTSFDAYGRVAYQFDDYRRKSDGTYIEARGTVQHYKFGQVFETLEARNKLEGKVYFKVKSL
ncbi:SpvB/TcaC N-terminal domain-containing protein, partial [Pseudoalteromonas luteoviolacea]|uniref:SpvB/TcaC N-terminal domain-containing protein n=1 Tax=Pseudoalteromonas luteoviolacea TaxID=43657 RepID=UPI0009C0CCAD